MKPVAIILGLLAIVGLIATGYLGFQVRGGADNLRNAHFHTAMTTALLSILGHIFAIVALLNKPAETKA